MSESFHFGGGATASTVHPAVALATLIVIVLTLVLRRELVIVPIVCAMLLIPTSQQVVLGGTHIFVSRILILCLIARMFTKSLAGGNPVFLGGLNRIDKALVVLALAHALAFCLLFRNSAAFVNQSGYLWDTLGGYFCMRHLVQSPADIRSMVKALACVAGVTALCMFIEQYKGINLFGYLGNFPLAPEVREGRVRSQGPFEHALLAGAFGGTSLPLFLWLWREKSSRLISALGSVSALIICVASACSTPLLALFSGVGALCLWPMRAHMRLLRWGIVAFLGVAAVLMKAPVWFLIAHIDLTGASSGYHRAMLIDQFLRHFTDWCLLGVKDASVWGFDMWDTCNQYVYEGESGGLIALLCLLAMIAFSFSKLGRSREDQSGDKDRERLLWFCGAALFANVVGFFGISYFDQTRFYWFSLLAVISAATVISKKKPAVVEASSPTPSEEIPGSARLPESYFWTPVQPR